MFDQFKKISSLKDLTNAVGLNEQELRARGLDGLEAGRNAFQQFNSLIMNRSTSSRSQSATPPPREEPSSGSVMSIEMPVTEQWSKSLESAWQELQTNNKTNYELSEQAQKLIDHLIKRCHEQAKYCEDFQTECSQLPEVSTQLKSMTTLADDLKGKLVQLDRDIDDYCKDYEQMEFEAWKRTQDHNLQQYMLDKKDDFLVKEHTLQQKYDIHVKDLTAKRIELYEANFKAEIDDYRHRRENQVNSLYQEPPRMGRVTQKLDNVTLDADDTHVLDDFLGDDDTNNKSSIKSTARDESEDEDDEPHDLVQADEDYISS
ncbi:hypothetical protein INT44_008234 [Umbelopsis vinacea]|uniref:Uncharacterized protein n=1 Tax=Umbelopsis vinacea TaxID=44442 RepID=A0A8H7PQ21_9FUNG|nr:hypothetical protein INT44_008234 [Umbelopsis vinacea]